MSNPLAALAAHPEVAASTDQVRGALTELRRHEALRRRSAEAAAEASVRAARASAVLAGARVPMSVVRDAVRGGEYPDDASGLTVRGAVRVMATMEKVATTWQRAPWQALASLHVAAAAGLVDDASLGRPRRAGEQPGDGHDLLDSQGRAVPAPDGPALGARLDSLVDLLTGSWQAPAVIVAALAHAEVAVVRPFVAGNGVVARALGRAVLIGRGLDPRGLSVWEAALVTHGPLYPLTLAAYATEGRDGVVAWLTRFSSAVVEGAAEGRAVCDAVLAGRLPTG